MPAIDKFIEHYGDLADQIEDIADRYFNLESKLPGDVDVVRLRCNLPLQLAHAVVLHSSAKDFTLTDSQSPAKLRKACEIWRIEPCVCIFLLDAARFGRPFFQSLYNLSQHCNEWPKASQALLDCAQARRKASTFLGFGVAKDAPGVIGHDISTATQRFSGISPADSTPTRKKTVAESNVENPITPQARKQEGISAAEEGYNGCKNQGAIENRPIATSSAASNIKSHENSLEDEAIPEAEDIEPENEANHTESQREGSDIESEDDADFDGNDTSEGESYIEANDYILDDPDDPDTSASNTDATSGQAATGGKDEVVGEQSVAEEPDAQAGGSFEEESYSSFEHFRHAEVSCTDRCLFDTLQ
ncbi:hypothetical protein N0V92_013487 [Colletotrichum tropicale]|nr:hypothetical protein N0V92_013487 [Colletotrichum tropicale]